MTNIIALIGYDDSSHRSWLRQLLTARGFRCEDFKTIRDFREKHPEAELDLMVCITRDSLSKHPQPDISNPCGTQNCKAENCSDRILPAQASDQSTALPSAVTDRFKKLTPRELQTLELLAHGWSSKQIAQKLGIALRTVANHRASIRSKTGFTSIAQLVRAYLQSPHSKTPSP